MKPVDDPSVLAELLGRDPETHLYGLADLVEPFWSNSTWHIDGEGAVGLISDGSGWVTGYAMSQSAPELTLALLAEVESQLPPGTWVTGPLTMSASLQHQRSLRSIGPHWRMILDDIDEIPQPGIAQPLDGSNLAEIKELLASDHEGAFFLESMLDQNTFFGVFDDKRLIAMAGTHVADRRSGVAAIGSVLTHPAHRGQGLGREVMSAVCAHLYGKFETIGLNVSAENGPAVALYEKLGFRQAFGYEEIELL